MTVPATAPARTTPTVPGGASDDPAADVARTLRHAQAAALDYHKDALRLPPPLRVHASIEGEGTVCHGERTLCEVAYWLKDVEEDDTSVFPTGHPRDGEPTDARTGSRGLYGFLRGSTKDNVLGAFIGTPLTLRAQDGRALEFTVTKVLTAEDALFPNYLVQGVSPA